MTATFEHKVLTYTLSRKGFDYARIEQDLNEHGRQGWETVGTLAPGIGSGHTQEIGIIVKADSRMTR